MDMIQEFAISEFLESKPGQKLQEAMAGIEAVQDNLLVYAEKDDSEKLKWLKIGTVFNLFLVDTLAKKGKRRANELEKEDWMELANKVSRYAVKESDQSYSEFVFDLYANYIDLSVKSVQAAAEFKNCEADKDALAAISNIANSLREKKDQLNREIIDEVHYTEDCLWLSLEAMVKLLSTFVSLALPKEYAQLLHSISQLGFEYGRYVLYAREQALLEEYIHNQYVLDDELKAKYEAYLHDVQENAARFDSLIQKAFSPDIHEALTGSADLARSYGVSEDEILETIEDIDSFFLD